MKQGKKTYHVELTLSIDAESDLEVDKQLDALLDALPTDTWLYEGRSVYQVSLDESA